MTHRWLRILISLTFVVLVISCSSTPAPAPSSEPASVPATQAPAAEVPAAAMPAQVEPASANDAEVAMVYIYRPKSFFGMALHPTVMLDGKDLINVANGTVWKGRFAPGHYVFQMDDKKSGAELDLKAGEMHYMKVEIVPGFWKGGGKMTLMAKEQGSLEIKELKPLPKNEVEHAAFKNQ